MKGRVLVRLICIALLAVAAVPFANADTFSVEASATLKAFRLIVFGGGEIDDVRGAALVDVSDPAPLGTISMFDPTGGVPLPDFLTLAFGNNIVNAGNSTFTEETQVVLDLTSGIVGPTSLSLFGVGTAVGTVTDAALAATIGKLEFDFSLLSVTTDPISGNVLATYQIASIENVPEPRAAVFLIFAISAIALLKIRQRA
jgi:hypothetical protein